MTEAKGFRDGHLFRAFHRRKANPAPCAIAARMMASGLSRPALFVACAAFHTAAWAQTPPALAERTDEQKSIEALQNDIADFKKAAAVEKIADDQKELADKKAKEEKKDEGGAADLAGDFKAGRLIRYGVTGGAAFAVHVPLQPEEQEQAGVSAMPYVAVFPFWWAIRGDVTRAYCGEFFSSADGESAMAYANTMATKLARTRKQKTDPSVNDEYKPSRTEILDLTGWDTELKGSCGAARMFGLYWGIPASFNVNGKAPDTSDAIKSRDFKPVSSVGLAFAPFAAVSLLLGYTWSHVNDDEIKAGENAMPPIAYAGGKNHTVHSLSVSVGGNLDLVGALLGGK
jgi:hypothetical protein